jgi:hypothetical protein
MRGSQLRVHLTKRIGEREVVWNFVRAEIESKVFGPSYASKLSASLELKVRQSQKKELTEEEWVTMERILGEIRPAYVPPLMKLNPEWWSGSIPIDLLPSLRIANYEPLRHLASNRLLVDYVRGLDGGGETPGDTAAFRYRRMRDVFDPKKVRGLPILAAEHAEGPFTIVEGLTRLSCLTSMLQQSKATQSEVAVVLGITPKLPEWRWA